jgi:hypothetical protein
VPKNSVYKGRIGPEWPNRGSPRTCNRNRRSRSGWTMPKRARSGHRHLHVLRALRKVPRPRCPPSSNMWSWTHGPKKKKKKSKFFSAAHTFYTEKKKGEFGSSRPGSKSPNGSVQKEKQHQRVCPTRSGSDFFPREWKNPRLIGSSPSAAGEHHDLALLR